MRLFVFGLGYTGCALAARVRALGWRVAGTGGGGSIAFEDEDAVRAELATATHVLSSVPPVDGRDPVLERYFLPSPAQAGVQLRSDRDDALRSVTTTSPTGPRPAPGKVGGQWLGYLSSTGVYGDTHGAWVDETAPTGTGRRGARAAADAAWLGLGARVFRLPGIYGPGRSALDRVMAGKAHRLGLRDQVFSRVHVADIVSGVIAGFDGPSGAYNLADDAPAAQDEVVAFAASLLGLPPPPLASLADLSPAARGFYEENRRVANGKAKRLLGWRPRYADYRAGLRSLSAITSPTITSAPPSIDSVDQR